MATLIEVARHLFMSDRRLREWIKRGDITERAQGEYDLDEVRKEYIHVLRRQAAGHEARGDLDLSGERAKLAREQAEGAAIRNAVSRGEYVAVDEVVAQVEREYGIVRERLLTIPGKVADALTQRDRETIESVLIEEISEVLDELHDPARGADRPGGVGREAS